MVEPKFYVTYYDNNPMKGGYYTAVYDYGWIKIKISGD